MFLPGFDPSKMKPEMIAKLSALLQELPPAQLQKIQSIMHNQMAGFDIATEMQALEREFPTGFREKMAKLMYEMHGVGTSTETASASPVIEASVVDSAAVKEPQNIQEARLMILNGVASGEMSPEIALKVLFPENK